MLNFSKIKILTIYFIFFFIASFTFLNFQSEEKKIFDKKINLGLDLQGGSYLLLEINTDSLVKQRLQDKVIPLKKFLNDNNFEYKNFEIRSKFIDFNLIGELDKLELLFFSKKDNEINPYIDKYNTHELDLIKKDKKVRINLSKYGLLTLNNSALKQSIEIVRKRIDDVGTREPTILQEKKEF